MASAQRGRNGTPHVRLVSPSHQPRVTTASLADSHPLHPDGADSGGAADFVWSVSLGSGGNSFIRECPVAKRSRASTLTTMPPYLASFALRLSQNLSRRR